MSQIPILIVGAGPTGLNLALRLARDGIPFQIIDEHQGPAQESRALAVQARTLEFYAQLGLAEEIVAAGTRVGGIRLLEGARERAHVPMGDLGQGLSPFPFVLDFPQDEHERFLVDRLRQAGVEVERSTRLLSHAQDETGIEALIGARGREETARFDYVCGCDGARSVVRKGLGVGFVPDGVENPSFENVRDEAERLLGIKVAELNWFSTYRVQHRVAERFHIGRAFLLGDAGHLHSPVGGQGMNTGIGDAVNLAWKLSAVVRGRAAPSILESYEPERIAFARQLVATTDRLFRLIVSEGLVGELFRTWVMPTMIPGAIHLAAAREMLFRTISQIAVHYRDSPLSEGKAGGIAGGDRLPWVEDVDNFAPLAGRDWRLQVFGEPSAEVSEAARGRGLALDTFAWSEAAHKAGFQRDAAYLVRPDGYVGLAASRELSGELDRYAARHGLRFASAGASMPTSTHRA